MTKIGLTLRLQDLLENEKERNPRRLRGKAQAADWQAANRRRRI